MCITFKIDGKRKTILSKNIRQNDDLGFNGFYRGYEITLIYDGVGIGWIAIATAPSGLHAVDGIFSGSKMNILKMCINNIIM